MLRQPWSSRRGRFDTVHAHKQLKRYRLLGPDGQYESDEPGTFGGHAKQLVYGRLDCPVALSLIRRGKFKAEYRVFFKDAETARACGYRPCGACLREEYNAWKVSTLS